MKQLILLPGANFRGCENDSCCAKYLTVPKFERLNVDSDLSIKEFA